MNLKLNLCLILTGEKNYDEAIKLATEVLETDPNHLKALFRRANAYLKKDDLKGAKDDLIKAYKLDKKNKGIIKLYKTCS